MAKQQLQTNIKKKEEELLASQSLLDKRENELYRNTIVVYLRKM